MAKYIVCPICGANLDHGEKCTDCAKSLIATQKPTYHPDELREVGVIPKKNNYMMQYI